MFRSGFPFQIWFLILSGLRLNPVLTLSYPFISLLFSFGCASTFFTSIALLKLDCEDLMYDSAQSLFFSPFFYPFFSRRIWCPPLLFHCRPSVHLPYSGILYRMYSLLRQILPVLPYFHGAPYPLGLCFLSCLHDPAGYSSCEVLYRW